MEEKENTDQSTSKIPLPYNNCKTTNLLSDVSVWKHSDRNYFTFVILSVVFGFFGFDHFYLRSFGTGFAKLFSNVTMFGFWYFWDVLQILNDKCNIQTNGLNSPFDWIRGIGRGTFDFSEKQTHESQKSFFVYGLLVLLLGTFGFDKFYVGAYGQGITKLIFNFIPFLFLFGWFWTFYDRYVFLFKPSSIMTTGLDAPLPFSWFFNESLKVNDQFEVLPIDKEKKDDKDSSWFSLSALFAPLIAFMKAIVDIIPWQPLYEALVVPVIRPPVQSAIATGTKAYTVGKAGVDLGTKVASEGKEAVSSTLNQLQQFSDPSYIADLAQKKMKEQAEKQTMTIGSTISSKVESNPLVQQVQQTAQSVDQLRQEGGSLESQSSVGPILAGSLTALLLAGGLKALGTYMN